MVNKTDLVFIFGSAALAFCFVALISWLTLQVSALWVGVLFTLSLSLITMQIAVFFEDDAPTPGNTCTPTERLVRVVLVSTIAFFVSALMSTVWFLVYRHLEPRMSDSRLASLYGFLAGLTLPILAIVVSISVYYTNSPFRSYMDCTG